MTFLALDVSYQRGDFHLEFLMQTDATALALFGPSGAGKTTLAHVLAGLLTPQRGSVMLNGIPLFDHQARINVPPQQRRIGYVFQDARLFPHLTIKNNLLYGRMWQPKGPSSIALEDVVSLLDLAPLLDRYPPSLSGGERQRVAIGRALMSEPRLLLLDEPLSALDEARKDEIIAYLKRLRLAALVPMITITHRREEVLLLADEVVFVDRGRCTGAQSTASFAAG
jgi:molybdate transport system ATP-binding protein